MLRVQLFCIVFPVFVSACSPNDSNSEEGAAIDGDDSLTTLVAAMCDGLGSCCRSQSFSFDRAACETAASGDIWLSQPSSEGAWHMEVLDECASLLRTALSACEPMPLRSVCDNVYGGSAATGEACRANSDCAPVSGAMVYCASTACAVRRSVGAGEACTATCSEPFCQNLYVAPGDSGYEILACNESEGFACVDGTCQPLPSGGEPCGAHGLCAAGAVCSAATETCLAKAKLGESCEERPCTSGSWCNAGTCVAPLPDGDLCFGDDECQSGVCDFDETDTELFCLPATEELEWDQAACGGSVRF